MDIDIPALKERYSDYAVRFENVIGPLPRLYIKFSDTPISWLNTATPAQIIVNDLGVINERTNIGLYQPVFDSRLQPMANAGSDALAMKNSGHYGAGKSFPLFTALKLYPESAYHLVTSGSEKSLYSIEGGLQHKALILSEALALESGGRKDNELAYAIRTLVSEGCLKYQYVGFENGKRLTIVKRIEGPTSLVTTTIKGKLEDQLDDRMITAHPDTSVNQTRDIIEQTASTAAGNDQPVDELTLQAWRHYHDSLLSVEVIVPYAADIASFISRQARLPISARRSFKRVLSAIKTMTLIYQKQRHRDAQGRFIADYMDYALVHQLLEASFAENLGGVKRYTDARIEMIEQAGMVTLRDLAIKTGVTTAAISQWSKPLMDKGVLSWCDENGAVFADQPAMEKAKRTGRANIRVVGGGKSLPSPFELTGDPAWDKGGELYEAYDLQLDDSGDDDVRGRQLAVTYNILSEPVGKYDAGDTRENDELGVKALSEKPHTEELKMIEQFGENQPSSELDRFFGADLFNEYSNILEKQAFGSVN